MARFVIVTLSLLLFVVLASAEVNKYLFVHGAWQNGTAFAGTVDALAKLGIPSRALNLPGNSPTATDALKASITFANYVSYMDSVMVSQQARTTLVCHSSAGVLCQTIVGRHSSRIHSVIFLSAWVSYPEVSQADILGPIFAPFTAAAAARPDKSVPIDAGFVSNVLLPSDSAANQAKFLTITFPQPIAYFTSPLTLQDSIRFNDTAFDIPRYYILPKDDTSAPFASLAKQAFGDYPYTTLQVEGGHQFFYFSPNTLVSVLQNIDAQSRNSASILSVSSMLVVVCVALMALMM